MKELSIKPEWPESWRVSHIYDKLEIWGDKSQLGYSYAYANRLNIIIEKVKHYLPDIHSANILDIAAAQGNFSLKLAELGYNVTWNDIRGELVDYVKLKYEKGNINYKVGNAFELGFENKFDAVIITEIIEHVAHPDNFLKQVAVMVKQGGYIFMTTPLGSYYSNKLPRFSECSDPSIYEKNQFKPNCDGHIFLLYKEEIEKIASSIDLKIKFIDVYNNPLTEGHMKTNRLLQFIPKSLIDFAEKISRKLPEKLRLKLHSNICVVFKK